ncbi:hypothetical protein QJQ45_023874 [Haematococcus lacustris]|nr:hypothetical protein QJQ45_023874 [Haematococcus lacustris]
MMRGPHHRHQAAAREVAVYERPSGAWLVAKLKELDEMHLTGDGNSLHANATKIITSIQEYNRHPGRFVKWWLDRDTNACLNSQRIGAPLPAANASFQRLNPATYDLVRKRLPHPPPLAAVAGQDIVLRPPVLLPHFIVYAEQQQQQQQPQQHVEQQGQQHQWQERHRGCGSEELGTSAACSKGAALGSALQHSTLHPAEVATVATEAAAAGRPVGMGSVLAAAVGPVTEPGAAVEVPNLPGLATEPEPVVEPRPTLEPEAAAESQPPEVPDTTAKSEEAVAVAVQATVAPEHVAEVGAAAEPDLQPAHGAIAGSAPPTSAPLLRHPPLPRTRPPITHRHSTIGFTQRHVSAHTGVGLAVAQVAFLLNSRPQTVQPPLTQRLSQPLPDGPNPRARSLLAATPLPPGPRALCHSASGSTAAYSTLQPSSSQLSSRGPIPSIGQLSGPATRPRPSPTAPSPVKGLPPLPRAPRPAKVPLSIPLNHVSSLGLALPSPPQSPSTQHTPCHPPRPGATAPPRPPSVSGTTAESLGLLSLRWSVSGSKAIEAPLEGEPQVGFAALGFSHSISVKSEEQWEEWSRGWVSSSGTAAQEQHSGLREVQEEEQEQVVNGMKWVSRQHYHRERGVAVFLGAGCFCQGRWKSKAVREGFRKVVQQTSRAITDPRPDRLVTVDEFRTSRVSSSVHARQPCELHLPDDRPRPADWVPPAGQVNQRLVRPAWSLRHAKWLDRDTNPCLSFQRIGESMQRPLELCSWEDREALPPVGKEYQQGYKRVNDRLPKVKQRLHQAAEYWRGTDGRARNNA